ncbi:MAG: N-6 DNA methylase [bacterium]|nr:N-6 DNA methylase [bacterium]
MSEELLQTAPLPLGRYKYHRLGASTLGQLHQARIVSKLVPPDLRTKKPDGLITLGKGLVKAYIEYKTPSELRTPRQVTKAINQEIAPARALCNLLIVTSGAKTFWINPHTGNQVQSPDALPPFNAKSIVEGRASLEYLQSLEEIVDRADHSLSPDNDELYSPSLIDPSQIAQSIWQKIWINTGKEPEKCLYNVVELFVFKFLSDLSVLKAHHNFEHVCEVGDTSGHEDALTTYAKLSRPAIYDLFPAGQDGTSIINGTIFVNERGEPNSSQSRLFFEVLKDLREYDRQHGSLKYIEKEFKTRLYEAFLRQGAGLHHLGQFFTPRNVVQAVVRMSGANSLAPGSSLCDPFCGVGGFLLEAILQCPRLHAAFQPVDGAISPDVTVVGYDRGSDEKEDERTIILAKANALIYFSDLLARYSSPDFAKEVSEQLINPMFQLLRSNLGTFEVDDESKHDLILTNPPYVTRGSASLKNAIEEAGIADRYSVSGRGTEALAMQWVIRSLTPGGTGIVIVPDGLLNQREMLAFIKAECVVKGIISLPERTFYATPKKTYILAITKKRRAGVMQTEPVFAYLVSETGETRDANRWTIPDNHLIEATGLYNQFVGHPLSFQPSSSRCKAVSWDTFDALEHWMLDRRCWNTQELEAMGVSASHSASVTVEEFNEYLTPLGIQGIGEQRQGHARAAISYREVLLGDEELFCLVIGKRVLRRDCVESGIPCISANVRDVFGYIKSSDILSDFTAPSLTWGIDGAFDWHFIPAGSPFHPTDHCGVLRVVHPGIDPEYLYFVLRNTRDRNGFDRTFRANLRNVGNVAVDVPMSHDGAFDLHKQREIARTYKEIEKRREHAQQALRYITDANVTIQ